jgi:hypothetical protein
MNDALSGNSDQEFAFMLRLIVRVQAETEEDARQRVAAVFPKGEVVSGVECTMVHTERVGP